MGCDTEDWSNDLPQHSLILDVKPHWNSLYLMIERFLEQYPAIQAASLDHRLRKLIERNRLALLTEPCGQILPILQKLDKHFTVVEEDTVFLSSIKQAVWENLSKRYQRDDIRSFLEEATALVAHLPESTRSRVDCEEGITMQSNEERRKQRENDITDKGKSEEENDNPPSCKRAIMSSLEELFAADNELKMKSTESTTLSIDEKVDAELKLYQVMPPTMRSDEPACLVVETEKRISFPVRSQTKV